MGVETIIKIGRETFPADSALGDLVIAATNAKEQVDIQTEQYKGLNKMIIEQVQEHFEHAGQINIIVPHICKVTIKESSSKKFKKGKVQTILEWLGKQGKEIERYVSVKYSPKAELLKLGEPEIFDCVEVKKGSHQFSYTAIR